MHLILLLPTPCHGPAVLDRDVYLVIAEPWGHDLSVFCLFYFLDPGQGHTPTANSWNAGNSSRLLITRPCLGSLSSADSLPVMGRHFANLKA